MIYALYGFIFGILIPYLSRRFAKFIPGSLAYGLYCVLKPHKSVSKAQKRSNPQYIKLVHHYLMRSLGWGIICSALSYLTYWKFYTFDIWWYLPLIWSLLLMTEIDLRVQLLPDIVTIPLLIAGFGYSAFTGEWLTPLDSAAGAALGYLVPAFAALLIVWKYPDAMGGGDIKLLAALGAWFGFEKLMYILVGACLFFLLTVVLYRKKREGAFGPSVACSAIIALFYFF